MAERVTIGGYRRLSRHTRQLTEWGRRPQTQPASQPEQLRVGPPAEAGR
jgi:hypothetical protein